MTGEGTPEDDGGESACFAHLICPECGVVLDGSEHVRSCTWIDPRSALDRMDSSEPGPGD